MYVCSRMRTPQIQASAASGIDPLSVEPFLGTVEVGVSEAAQVAVWWVGVHGGAGESTLETLFAGSCATAHRWPTCAGCRLPVVLVARTHAGGLRAVQVAMREHVECSHAARVLGLVLIADAPGRLPRPLRDLLRVVAGGVPAVWSLPFVNAWRLGELPTRSNSPKQAGQLRDELRTALAHQQEES